MLIVRTLDGVNMSWTARKRGRLVLSVPVMLGVVHVTADGEELDYIRAHFSGLPGVNGAEPESMTWFGDHARFIAANLS